jgi:hypothetical protein
VASDAPAEDAPGGMDRMDEPTDVDVAALAEFDRPVGERLERFDERVDRLVGIVEAVDDDRLLGVELRLGELRRVGNCAVVAGVRRDHLLDRHVVRLAVVAAKAGHLYFDDPLRGFTEPRVADLATLVWVVDELSAGHARPVGILSEFREDKGHGRVLCMRAEARLVHAARAARPDRRARVDARERPGERSDEFVEREDAHDTGCFHEAGRCEHHAPRLQAVTSVDRSRK